ncbi:MAG: YHYH protein, partial [Gemmataceae bacterium]
HVQPNGAYHYHGVPSALIEVLAAKKGTDKTMLLLGWAADGFPIYGPYGHTNPKDKTSAFAKVKPSYRLRQGQRPNGPGGNFDGTFVEDYEYVQGAGDLDECNGRVGVTPEFPDGIYHYYLTEEFPFIPRAFRGTPDRGFLLPHGPPPFPPPFGKGKFKGPPPPPR